MGLTQCTRTNPSSAPEAYPLPCGCTARVLMGPLHGISQSYTI